MPKTDLNLTESAERFAQSRIEVGELQVLSASDELFNHVDDDLPMWSGVGDRNIDLTIKFVRAFKSRPHIILSITGLDAAHDQNLRYWLTASNIDRFQFTMNFSTWHDTHLARVGVSWQAVGPRRVMPLDHL
ncbi:H-type lectin domain-containing protein [uncultured Tateyamaria sp.]|uniref:H-type lectin domain-containing protein n=1 Tax=uncultured Tateyamaria sp. TaxID=455651 RepID=UPI00262FF4DF|nr:H-type lectin domain-containing protein [uncultured Tateyamaria sp.]